MRKADARVKVAAARLLGKYGPAAQDAMDALRGTMLDAEPAVRQAASEAVLAILAAPDAISSLPARGPTISHNPAPVVLKACAKTGTGLLNSKSPVPVCAQVLTAWRPENPASGIVQAVAWEPSGLTRPPVALLAPVGLPPAARAWTQQAN